MTPIVQPTPSSTSRGKAFSLRLLAARGWLSPSVLGLGLALGVGVPAFGQIPGPESFVAPLKTPVDYWEVVDYLIRTGQINKAAPFLTKFEALKPDDDTLVRLREQFGHNSFLRLLDYKETRAAGERLTQAVAEASRKVATRPERLKTAMTGLAGTNEERNIALEQLHEAGEYAFPTLISGLQDTSLTPQGRASLMNGMAKLEGSAFGPLTAALNEGPPEVATSVAQILGNTGDTRAVPDLTIAATSGKPQAKAAQDAIARITGVRYEAQPLKPVRVLDEAARVTYLDLPHIAAAPENIWAWDANANTVVAKPSTRVDAAVARGLRFARAAATLDPKDLGSRVDYVTLLLERETNRDAATKEASAAGANVLSEVLKRAIADKRYDVVAAAIPLLAKATDAKSPESLTSFVTALSSTDRRVQFAAAEAIVGLNPRRAFAGSSRVVPTLSRFAAIAPYPRAVVIDGNLMRGAQVLGYLKTIGYDAVLAATGEVGFRIAANSADVELIVIDPDLVQGSWRLLDTLSNLRADNHTAGIPTFIVGSQAMRFVIEPKLESFPNVRFLITPTEATLFKRQIDDSLARLHAKPLSNQERLGLALKASTLLGQIATNNGNPFEGELPMAGPSLTIAVNTPSTAEHAAVALGDLATIDAQRDLADVVLNPSLGNELRLVASSQLVKSIKRFGPLVSHDQERRLTDLIRDETDVAMSSTLKGIVDALKRKPAQAARPVQSQRPGYSVTR